MIFCSIDDKNQAYVKCLFDDVFGEGNFVGDIVWQKKNSGGQHAKFILDFHEYILCYAKNIEALGAFLTYRTEKQRQSFKLEDEFIETKGRYLLSPLKSWLDYRETLIYDIECPDGTTTKTQWVCAKDTFQRLKNENRIVFKKNKNDEWSIYKKQYENENEGLVKTPSLWLDCSNNANATRELSTIFTDSESGIFSNPKPVALLKRIIEISSAPNSIILDFYAGSGTTGHAVLELNRTDGGNRQFILVTNNEETEINPNGIAYDVTAKRLKRIMTGECYEGGGAIKWLEKNKPYGDSLEVYDIEHLPADSDKIFESIDESLYDQPRMEINEKIDWVCENFEKTCKREEEK
ncbi:hypothetical protein BKH46_08650 [Helicobacter sp. 12S02634-8]|nr:hypothetical protein BKH46_08650 [Helicobacter sp. 12S02634-8]